MSKQYSLQRLEPVQIGPTNHQMSPPAASQNATIAFLKRTFPIWICVAYLCISGSLILLNKQILVDDGFRFPLTLAFLGMASSSIFSYVVCKRYNINVAKDKITWDVYVRSILPIGACMAATLHLSNLVYLHLTVSLIQMLKATSPIMVMLALYFARLEKPTVTTITTVIIIAVGTATASFGQINLSILGLTVMLTAELLEAVKLVMMQKLLVGLEFHPIEGLMYLAPACCFWLLLAILFVESGRIITTGALLLMLRSPVMYLSAAIMGFFVNLAAYMVIHQTSSLTLKILGTIRSAMIVLIASLLMGEHVTTIQLIGYAVELVGFYGYTLARMQAAQQAILQAAQKAHQTNLRPGSILNVR